MTTATAETPKLKLAIAIRLRVIMVYHGAPDHPWSSHNELQGWCTLVEEMITAPGKPLIHSVGWDPRPIYPLYVDRVTGPGVGVLNLRFAGEVLRYHSWEEEIKSPVPLHSVFHEYYFRPRYYRVSSYVCNRRVSLMVTWLGAERTHRLVHEAEAEPWGGAGWTHFRAGSGMRTELSDSIEIESE